MSMEIQASMGTVYAASSEIPENLATSVSVATQDMALELMEMNAQNMMQMMASTVTGLGQNIDMLG